MSQNRIYHLYKLKLVSKMALKKWNTNFYLEYSIQKNRTTFSDLPLLPEIFCWNDQKSHVLFTFQPDFPELFVNGKQPVFHFWLYCHLCQPKMLHHSVVPARFISKRGFASRGDPLIKMMRLIVIPLWFKMRKWVMHNQKKGPLWH